MDVEHYGLAWRRHTVWVPKWLPCLAACWSPRGPAARFSSGLGVIKCGLIFSRDARSALQTDQPLAGGVVGSDGQWGACEQLHSKQAEWRSGVEVPGGPVNA